MCHGRGGVKGFAASLSFTERGRPVITAPDIKDMKTTQFHLPFLLATLTFVGLAGCGGDKGAAEPEAPAVKFPTGAVTISCAGPAGGVADKFCRAVATAMSAQLGGNVSVQNVGTATDGAAFAAAWDAGHDGHQWVGFSDDSLGAEAQAAGKVAADEWTYFLIAESPAIISAPPRVRFNKLQTLIREAKKEDDIFKITASTAGTVWHAKLRKLEAETGAKFAVKEFGGTGPSQLAVVSGQADAVISSAGDQASLIKSKKLVPLAVLGAAAFNLGGHGEIPAAADLYPGFEDDPVRAVVGFALPADVPADVLEAIGKAFDAALADPAVVLLAGDNHMRILGLRGTAADAEVVAAVETRANRLRGRAYFFLRASNIACTRAQSPM